MLTSVFKIYCSEKKYFSEKLFISYLKYYELSFKTDYTMK